MSGAKTCGTFTYAIHSNKRHGSEVGKTRDYQDVIAATRRAFRHRRSMEARCEDCGTVASVWKRDGEPWAWFHEGSHP